MERSKVTRILKAAMGPRYLRLRARLLGEAPPPNVRAEARRLQESGLFDAQFYARIRRLDARADAALDYVVHGAGGGLPFHPLVEPEYLPPEVFRALRAGWVSAALDHLAGDAGSSWGPRLRDLADPTRALDVLRQAGDGYRLTSIVPGGPASIDYARVRDEIATAHLEAVGARPEDARGPVSDVEWSAARDGRVAGRTSVIMLTYQDHAMTTRAVDQVLRTTGNEDVEIILVDNASRPAVARVLRARYLDHPRVTYLRQPANLNFGPGTNIGVLASTGEHVMLLNNDTIPLGDWLGPLRDRLQTDGVIGTQPLLLYPDATVQTAGTVFAGHQSLATHFLTGHPMADALRHDGADFTAVTAGALLLRACDFIDLGGFVDTYINGQEDVDFCLRAVQRFGGAFAVESRSVVIHEESKSPGRLARAAANRTVFMNRWRGQLPGPESDQFAKIGLSLVHSQPDLDGPFAIARPLVIRPARTTPLGEPLLRISLRTPLTYQALAAGLPLDDELAAFVAELERAGHEVVLDAANTSLRASAYLDSIRVLLPGSGTNGAWLGRPNVVWLREGEAPAGEWDGIDLVLHGDSEPPAGLTAFTAARRAPSGAEAAQQLVAAAATWRV